MADHDEMVAHFVELTQSPPESARAVLESSNWQLEDALNLFYAAPEEASAAPSRPSAGQPQDLDDDDFDAPQTLRRSTPPPVGASGVGRTLAGGTVGEPSGSSSSGPSHSAPPPKKRGGLVTLGDLGRGVPQGHGHGQDDDSDDDHGQDMFAGGEKSGLAIENPSRPGNHGLDSVRNIIKQAQEHRQNLLDEDEEAIPRNRFAGRGQTLGSDDTPSQVIDDPYQNAPRSLPKVTRNMYFWKDGFSVEDGPLLRYDDPQHQETLRGIEAGRAPLHLMNVEPGQSTDVNVHRRMEEAYVPPKAKFVPFFGSGQRLGAPTPGFDSTTASSSRSAPVAPAPVAPATVAPTQPAPQTVIVDSTQPTAALQIRLGDGTRLVSRFNHTHTLAEVYAFVNAANTASRSRSYVLQTGFPPKELNEMGQSLKDAGLLNAVVVQKWK
ncbi:hypothetical protein DRE_06304 [Drechslerella stenobrocha 248]|uniref:UBX domain-containing protein 1 n=1 Tax=Drechslerella stenobrocha 248 TaxID=1043628 RepID=W7HPG7_9PEZI|nr:hypothetical protein DRE_06304 [Drechslerella stenobrocha 248]